MAKKNEPALSYTVTTSKSDEEVGCDFVTLDDGVLSFWVGTPPTEEDDGDAEILCAYAPGQWKSVHLAVDDED